MDSQDNYIGEGKISLGYLIQRLRYWVLFILSKWLKIGLGTVVVLLLVVGYNYLKPKVFTAKATFVLDNDSSGGLGDLGSIASLAGINVGGIAEGGILFQIDNIQELYRSNRMLEKTLLSPIIIDREKVLLINRFAESNKLTNKWLDEGVELARFNTDRESFTRKQDSLLLESIKLVKEKFLFIDKPNRKTTILEIGFRHEDEFLAKLFTETHVRNVNEFYLETKTKKSLANLRILQNQADSIKRVLDESLLNLARIDETMPNPNPLYKTSQVPYQKAMIDVQANSSIYQEVVKQLELAKVAHRNQMPLIQVIDKPILPLPDNQWSLFKALVIGGFVGLCLMTLYFLIKEVVDRAILEI
ncbi:MULTISPECIES: GumC domain-containing protein [Roseivirga]|uniref:Polysaccharide chain length determinant N-terminal domain-containing protein n=1 Tax=Roseivirga spongicola TaxID=333140 RepID=A0A150XHK3_9BACT|nr:MULTISPECIES: hypothetical protein [Roseivirga]KYG78199.1 hypothetical protein AWW68_05380 [Roseivirga spongicola]MBO6660977.1 exopolysaccharide biosynthesis protein [Roseivirga sp.]MBO6761365.1 exopolysaccharide biosynthesis protein [Roseivirga sp.]MBO6909039.1 exopolysaccharide biosynthesis protein [Roseivirga sp.]WPZ11944.1 exopolysaccharide biosynthesis protein [Roseivirga spongicola]